MPDSLVVNYVMVRVSKLIRDTESNSNVLLISNGLIQSANSFVANTWIPLYSNAYANSVMTISSYRY